MCMLVYYVLVNRVSRMACMPSTVTQTASLTCLMSKQLANHRLMPREFFSTFLHTFMCFMLRSYVYANNFSLLMIYQTLQYVKCIKARCRLWLSNCFQVESIHIKLELYIIDRLCLSECLCVMVQVRFAPVEWQSSEDYCSSWLAREIWRRV